MSYNPRYQRGTRSAAASQTPSSDGGALGVGDGAETGDPLIGKPVVMQDNPFGNPDDFSPGTYHPSRI